MRIGILKIKTLKKSEDKFEENSWEEKLKNRICDPGNVYQLDDFAYAQIDIVNKIYKVIEPEIDEKDLKFLSIARNWIFRNIKLNSKSLEENFIETLNKFFEKFAVPEKLRPKLKYYLFRDFVGYEKINALMKDPNIEDISCSGWQSPIYVYHSLYGSLKTNLRFEKEELDSFVSRLAQRCGKHISIAEPVIDASLPDGSRVNLTFQQEVTKRGSTFTIRKFKQKIITPIDLIKLNSISPEMLAYLWILIERKASIIVAGEIASGKTTLLNAFSLFIPKNMKIVSIEDTPEIRLPHENWIPAVTRMRFFGEGKDISMYDLLKASLRQRPDYIIVGEIRGEEALTLFQAMATGHLSLATIHSKSPSAVIERLISPPMNVPKIMIPLLDCICMQNLVKEGGSTIRRTQEIWEVLVKGGEVLLKDVFVWNRKEFEYRGSSKIKNMGKDLGIDLEEELFKRAKLLKDLALKNIGFEEFWRVISCGF
ncbi:MAG: type II/IV secretion system ATPase subunit [Archaeoglobaceae archaeon]|nr:type II/IV secretion system ATPase subunit [Archaeoglobaceae archaeon]